MKKIAKSVLFTSMFSLSLLFSCAQQPITQSQNNITASGNSIEKNFKIGAIIDTKSLQDYSSVSNFKVGTKWDYNFKLEDSKSDDSSTSLSKSLISGLYNFDISMEITGLTDEDIKMKAAMKFPNNPTSEQIFEKTFNKKDFLQLNSIDSSTPLNTNTPKDKDIKVNYKYEGMETITTDSGKTYNTVKISSDLDSSEKNITAKSNSWIAKDIGLIKSEVSISSPIAFKYIIQLKDFKN